MLTKTNSTIKALITPTTPVAAFATVELTSAMPIPPWFGSFGLINAYCNNLNFLESDLHLNTFYELQVKTVITHRIYK